MNSINFPNMFNKTTTNTVSNYNATKQNLELLLASDKGALVGDPYFGTGLKQYLFDQNDTVLMDLMKDGIFSAIKLFMPQIVVKRDDIVLESDKGRVTVTIRATNQADFTTNMYNIILTQSSV